MRQPSLWAAFVLTGVLGGAAPALAQDPEPKNPNTDGAATYEEVVVVTASAIEREADHLPASVTVIDAEEIEARQAVSIADLVASAPGTTVTASGPPGQVTSAFVRGAESDQVLLLWNGVELNDPYFGAVNWAFLPADGVERVEVVRGPFSALHGGNAVGGVVQVFTGAREGGKLRLEAGEKGYTRAGLAAGHSFGDGPTGFRLDVTGHSRRGDSELANGFFDSDELVARLNWTPREGVEVGVLARVDDSQTGIPFSGGQPSPERTIAWKEREIVLPVKVESGAWSLAGQLSQVDFESAFRDPQDPFGFTRSDTDSQARRGRALATWRANDRFAVALGGEVERLEVTDSSSFGSNLDAADQRTWALFSELSWNAGPLAIQLGARRDDNDVFGAETSLRAGSVLRLGEAWRVHASYGEAFRPPTLGELFFPTSGNPDLQPERADSYEVGVAFQSRGQSGKNEAGVWRFALVAFENRQTNLIDFDFATFQNINIGRARSRGAEASLGREGSTLDARANLTYLDAEDRGNGLPLLRRPEWSANLVATLTPVEDWSFTLTGRFVGDRPDVDPITFARADNPSYLRLDLATRWSLGKPGSASGRFAPYARVENLADEEYAEALGFPAPGRTFVAGIAVGF